MNLDTVHPARRLLIIGGHLSPYVAGLMVFVSAVLSIPAVSTSVLAILPDGFVPAEFSLEIIALGLAFGALLSTFFFRGLDRLAAKIFKEA
jgi:hypothetical protein